MRLKLLTVALALAAMPFASHAEDLLDAYRRPGPTTRCCRRPTPPVSPPARA